jgi:hypothetical protein
MSPDCEWEIDPDSFAAGVPQDEELDPPEDKTAAEAKYIVKKLARYLQKHELDWKLPHVLARKLRGLGDMAERYREQVGLFCELTHQSFTDFWPEFVHVWDNIVVFPENGPDSLALAFEHAKREPIPLPANITTPAELYSFVFSLCWHLAVRTCPLPFFLPRKRLAEMLGCKEHKTISRVVQWLEKKGLLECVDDKWQPGKKCKKYRLKNYVH